MPYLIQVTPIWKPHLEPFETPNVRSSLTGTSGWQLEFLAPQGLDVDFYRAEFPHVVVRKIADHHLRSVADYNALLFSPDFYRSNSEFEFLAIVQTDAFLLKDFRTLDLTDIDYLGAPWTRGLTYRSAGSRVMVAVWGRRVGSAPKSLMVRLVGRTAWVGNGGLSMRRASSPIRVTEKIQPRVPSYLRSGLNEDVALSTADKDAGLRVVSRDFASRAFREHVSSTEAIALGLVGVHVPAIRDWSSDSEGSIARESDSARRPERCES